MGIRQLDTFVRAEVPPRQINIEQEIRRHYKKTRDNPVIVIDLMSMYASFCSDLVGLLCGGRYVLVYKHLNDFFQRLRNAGAKLVFFCDGPVQSVKYATWFERHEEKYKEMLQIMDAIDEGMDLQTLIQRFRSKIPSCTYYPFKQAAMAHGELRNSFTNECDKEIVAYANSVDAMAIISNDSDFLIYKGFWRYWSSRDLKINTLKTIEYNRVALVSHLGLKFYQMPLLATLCGNDIIKYDEVRRFHDKLGPRAGKFHHVARLVRKQRLPLQDDQLKELLELAFSGGPTTPSYELEERFQQSLDSYDTNKLAPAPDSVNDEALTLATQKVDTFFYQVWMDIPLNITGFFIDLRSKSVGEQYTALSTRAVLRQIAILLYHRRRPQFSLVYKRDHQTPYALRTHKVEYPEHFIPPPLPVLLAKNSSQGEHDDGLRDIKYAMYCWIASDTLDHRLVMQIPEVLVPAIVTIYNLVENFVLNLYEADLLLKVACDVAFKTYDPEQITLQRPSLDGRAFRIAFLFLKMGNHFWKSLELVGLDYVKDCMKFAQFDGVLFHNLYDSWDQQMDERFAKFRIYEALAKNPIYQVMHKSLQQA